MSAIGSPWNDIDKTKPQTPYVVDNDGWGWFLLFIIVALPFLLLFGVIFKISNFICLHPILSALVFLVISLITGIFIYSKHTTKHKFCGVISTVITFLPLGLVTVIYTIPHVMFEDSFSSFFDLILIELFLLGFIYFILAICRLLKNGLTHLLISIVFFSLSLLIIKSLVASESGIITLESLYILYGF